MEEQENEEEDEGQAPAAVRKTVLPVDPGLGALGKLGEGQLAQVEVLLRVEDATLQQLLPAHTRHHQSSTEHTD